MVEIKINGKFIAYDEAKKLYDELYIIFGRLEYTPFIPYQRWVEAEKTDWRWPPIITCTTNTKDEN